MRLATHNVRGLACHLQQLARQWVEGKLDVVCVQETHCAFFNSAKLAKDLNAACQLVSPKHRGFTPVWCFNTTGNANASAGIVVLVRTVLLVSGAITWVTTPEHATRQEQGRLLGITFRWGGHTIKLVTTHLPNAASDQVHFIQQQLGPAVGGRTHVLLGGGLQLCAGYSTGSPVPGRAGEPAGPGVPTSPVRGQVPRVG